eukprot:g6108.t1
MKGLSWKKKWRDQQKGKETAAGRRVREEREKMAAEEALKKYKEEEDAFINGPGKSSLRAKARRGKREERRHMKAHIFALNEQLKNAVATAENMTLQVEESIDLTAPIDSEKAKLRMEKLKKIFEEKAAEHAKVANVYSKAKKDADSARNDVVEAKQKLDKAISKYRSFHFEFTHAKEQESLFKRKEKETLIEKQEAIDLLKIRRLEAQNSKRYKMQRVEDFKSDTLRVMELKKKEDGLLKKKMKQRALLEIAEQKYNDSIEDVEAKKILYKSAAEKAKSYAFDLSLHEKTKHASAKVLSVYERAYIKARRLFELSEKGRLESDPEYAKLVQEINKERAEHKKRNKKLQKKKRIKKAKHTLVDFENTVWSEIHLNAVTKMQCAVRVKQGKRKVRNLRRAKLVQQSVVAIQSSWRGSSARKVKVAQIVAVKKIQAIIRGKLGRDSVSRLAVVLHLEDALIVAKRKAQAAFLQKKKVLREKEILKAALMIQKLFRDVKARQERRDVASATLLAIRKAKEIKAAAALKVQAQVRRCQAQTRVCEMRNAKLEEKENAAQTLQNGWRSRDARVELMQRRKTRDERIAAELLQSGWRMHEARAEVARRRQARDEIEAAKLVQNGWRAHDARAEVARRRQARDEEEAAQLVQNGWRARDARAEVARRRQARDEEEAAKIMQKQWRLYKAREVVRIWQNSLVKDEETLASRIITRFIRNAGLRQKSAVIIQKVVRGRRDRLNYEMWRNAAITIQSFYRIKLTVRFSEVGTETAKTGLHYFLESMESKRLVQEKKKRPWKRWKTLEENVTNILKSHDKCENLWKQITNEDKVSMKKALSFLEKNYEYINSYVSAKYAIDALHLVDGINVYLPKEKFQDFFRNTFYASFLWGREIIDLDSSVRFDAKVLENALRDAKLKSTAVVLNTEAREIKYALEGTSQNFTEEFDPHKFESTWKRSIVLSPKRLRRNENLISMTPSMFVEWFSEQRQSPTARRERLPQNLQELDLELAEIAALSSRLRQRRKNPTAAQKHWKKAVNASIFWKPKGDRKTKITIRQSKEETKVSSSKDDTFEDMLAGFERLSKEEKKTIKLPPISKKKKTRKAAKKVKIVLKLKNK